MSINFRTVKRIVSLLFFLTAVIIFSLGIDALRFSAASSAAALPADLVGTIAYVSNMNEIRLIEGDGSNDRLVWRVPNPGVGSITGLDWKPDATGVAFTSDFENACSLRRGDLYTINSDGANLKRVTLGPLCTQLASYAKGTVTVRVVNATFDVGVVFIYAQGAPQAQQLSIAPGTAVTVTIPNVADLGEGVAQPVIATAGFQTWIDPVVIADVVPNSTVHAGELTLSNANKVENWAASSPSWRRDGGRIAFSVGSVGLYQISPAPPAGSFGDIIVAGGGSLPPGAVAYSPVSNEIIFFSGLDSIIYRATPGQPGPPQALVQLEDAFIGMDWLPDGSGFVFAEYSTFFAKGNIYEYRFAGPSLIALTNNANGSGEYNYHPSVSPNGQYIVFAHYTEGGSARLYVRTRDGSQVWPLGVDGEYPNWGETAVTPPSYKIYLPLTTR